MTKRALSFMDIIILAFSTMIGWGWIMLTGSWVNMGGGVGAAVAFLGGAVLCIFVGLTYCELTPALPYAGGELVFSYKAMGYSASFFTGWMITFAYIGVAAWEGPALATAMDYLFDIPRIGYLWTVAGFDVYASWLVIPIIAGAALTFVNLKGVKVSAVFQAIVTCLLAVGGIVFIIVGIVKGNLTEYAKPAFTTPNGVFSVFLAVPAMFVGFDVIPQVAEEMKVPLKKIPKAIIFSICLAAAWYIFIILSAFIMAPKGVLAEDGITVVNAIVYATGNPVFGSVIIIVGIMGIITSWNGFIIGATRVLYSMGRAKMLPSLFGTENKKNGAPIFATVFVGGISMLTPLLGKNTLSWFVNASSFGTVLAYLMVVLSFVLLRIKQPELPRPYKVKYGKLIGTVALLFSIFFIFLYLPIGPSSLKGVEWFIVLLWVLLGIVLYFVTFKRIKTNKTEREKALFNEE